jgi:hypothetical protein
MVGRVLREPLVHFLALALLVFAAYHFLTSAVSESKNDRIIVTTAKMAQLSARFSQAWQRPPTTRELKGLIDEQVREEIYVREATALGLDKDDTVIRRRLRQKIELLVDAGAEVLAPTDAELEAYLEAHPEKFVDQLAMSFQQVFFNTRWQGTGIGDAVNSALRTLASNPETDAAALGDATLLPTQMPLTNISAIGHIFGVEFADAIGRAKVGVWTGPITSAYGVHVVRLSERQESRSPALGEVRDAVVREWTNDRRNQLGNDHLDALLKRYEVIVETAPAPVDTTKP